MILTVPLVVAVIGALAYALAANGKLAELGRIAYAAAMFALMFGAGGALHLLR